MTMWTFDFRTLCKKDHINAIIRTVKICVDARCRTIFINISNLKQTKLLTVINVLIRILQSNKHRDSATGLLQKIKAL